jgi:hypothetical protein
MGELAIVMARCQGILDARVLFYQPVDVDQTWQQTDLWRDAESIPGVSIAADRGAALASRFSVSTSGHALLFSRRGELLFSGGITGSRGHSGDNCGRDAVISLLTTGTAECRTAHVFGCSLLPITPAFSK